MNGLDGMVRLSKWQLDEARKALVAAESELAAFARAIERLEREIEAERKAADDAADVMTSGAFGVYAAAALRRRAALEVARDKAERACECERERTGAAFTELKKYQILAARREEQRRAEEQRREQKSLDEIGTQRFREI